eukprot:16449485-Heterocapsa_arctica.AAC.1
MHHSHGFHISKGNDKVGIASRRLLHGLPPISKAIRQQLFVSCNPQPFYPHNVFGCVPKRIREEAIASQFVLGYRTRKVGLFVALVLYDLANAFPSTKSESLINSIENCQGDPTTTSLLCQHIECANCSLDTPSGQLHFRPGGGVFPGSSVATDLFNATSWDEFILPWAEDCLQIHTSYVTNSVITGKVIDLSATIFGLTTLLKGSQASLLRKSVLSPLVFHNPCVCMLALLILFLMAPIKQAVTEARRLNQQFARTGVSDLGVIAREATYLGPVIHHQESLFPERTRRLEAAARAFRAFGGYWTSKASKSIRVLIFRAVVITTLLDATT